MRTTNPGGLRECVRRGRRGLWVTGRASFREQILYKLDTTGGQQKSFFLSPEDPCLAMPLPSISGMEPPFGDAFENYSFTEQALTSTDQALTSTDLLASSSDPDFMYELDRDVGCRQSPGGPPGRGLQGAGEHGAPGGASGQRPQLQRGLRAVGLVLGGPDALHPAHQLRHLGHQGGGLPGAGRLLQPLPGRGGDGAHAHAGAAERRGLPA
ncbi:hypothetical protein COCON_G00040290, partial [Conger conger]